MALRTNRNFRWLFAGRLTTNAGDSLYLIATMWLVYDLTGSTLYTGIATFLLTAPNAVGFLMGPLADRWPSKRVLIGSQAVQGIVLAAVVLAWVAGYQSVWLLLVVIPILNLVNTLVYPTMNAVLPRIVETDDLMQANAAFAISFRGLDTTFNAVAGIAIAAVGALAIYAIDVLTFLVALVCYAIIHIPERGPFGPGDPDTADSDGGSETRTVADGGSAEMDVSDGDSDAVPGQESASRYVTQLREGIDIFRQSLLWKLSAAIFLGILTYWAMFATLPAFAATLGGASTYGFLLAGLTGGILVGFIFAPRLGTYPLGWVYIVFGTLGAIAWAAAITVDTLSHRVALAVITTIIVGYSGVSGQTIFQSSVPEHLLGRVTALHLSVAGVAAPLGALLGGFVGDLLGTTAAVALLAFGHLAVTSIFLLDPALRTLPKVGDIGPAELGINEA